MAGEQRIAGLLSLQINGEVQLCEGDFSFNPGTPKREAMVGSDGVHGYREVPQVAFIEGNIRDRRTLDLINLTKVEDATVTLQAYNGAKVYSLRHAWWAGDGTVNVREGTIAA